MENKDSQRILDIGKEQEIDVLLREALPADKEPKPYLNERILHQWSTQQDKKYQKRKRLLAAAMATTGILAVSITVGAAAKYLTGRQVMQQLERLPEEQEAFLDAIVINESKEAGEYRFTLLEIASGDKIMKEREFGCSLEEKVSYVIIAIERLDGKPMPKPLEDSFLEQEKFFISPLIQGLLPFRYNIATMHGKGMGTVKDGVFYRIISCDNIEKFADRKAYLCISNTSSYDIEAYYYNEDSGEISRNEDYKGINLLFDLPLDKTKADPEAAKEYIRAMEEDNEDNEDNASAAEKEKIDTEVVGEETETDTNIKHNKKKQDSDIPTRAAHAGYLADEYSAEDILNRAVLIEESIQVLEKQKDGLYYYRYHYNEDDQIRYSFKAREVFKKKTGYSKLIEWAQGDDYRDYILCYRDKKGIITGYVYREIVDSVSLPTAKRNNNK